MSQPDGRRDCPTGRFSNGRPGAQPRQFWRKSIAICGSLVQRWSVEGVAVEWKFAYDSGNFVIMIISISALRVLLAWAGQAITSDKDGSLPSTKSRGAEFQTVALPPPVAHRQTLPIAVSLAA